MLTPKKPRFDHWLAAILAEGEIRYRLLHPAAAARTPSNMDGTNRRVISTKADGIEKEKLA